MGSCRFGTVIIKVSGQIGDSETTSRRVVNFRWCCVIDLLCNERRGMEEGKGQPSITLPSHTRFSVLLLLTVMNGVHIYISIILI